MYEKIGKKSEKSKQKNHESQNKKLWTKLWFFSFPEIVESKLIVEENLVN